MLAALLLSVASLVTAPQVEAPAPLFPAPAGWQTERLPFPLDFAPELEFRGFEDLAFAPGMFQKGSDSYFSYVLALELEGDVAIDAAFLEHFLVTYYRGLCRAVAESRKLTLALDEVTARVEGGGDHLRAEIACFDPFTDGGALRLALELRTHARAGKTELFGIASPLPREAPIWKELAAVHQAWARTRTAALFLHHVTLVVDRATFEACRAEPFLRELAPLEERKEGGSGLVLHGRRTYLELVPADESGGRSAGHSTLAFALERAGASDWLAIELHRRGLPSRRVPVTRAHDGSSVPWYTRAVLELPPGPLALESIEYSTRHLAQWRPELAPRTGSIGRSEHQTRSIAALGAAPAEPLFVDLTQVTLALDAAQRERLERLAAVTGLEVRPEADAQAVRLLGAGHELLLMPSATPGAVTRCRVALARELRREPLTLGQLRLRFEGGFVEIESAP